jgi:hypothetical protein
MTPEGGSRADRAVAEQVARAEADAAAQRVEEAKAVEVSLEPLREEIRAEAPLALARLEIAGFPGGTMLQLDRTRLIGQQTVRKAAWELERHQGENKGEKIPTSTWLISDGRIMGDEGHGSFREIVAEITDQRVLQDILKKLRNLGATEA